MIVKELIEKLQSLNPEADIGDEFGLLELWNEETGEWREYKYKGENIYGEKVYAPTLTSYFIK